MGYCYPQFWRLPHWLNSNTSLVISPLKHFRKVSVSHYHTELRQSWDGFPERWGQTHLVLLSVTGVPRGRGLQGNKLDGNELFHTDISLIKPSPCRLLQRSEVLTMSTNSSTSNLMQLKGVGTGQTLWPAWLVMTFPWLSITHSNDFSE